MSDVRPPCPTRRRVLAGGLLLLATGCTGRSGSDAPTLTSDQRLARRAAAEIRALASRYAATVSAHPDTRARLSPLAAEHEAHVRALDALVPTSSPTPTGSPSPSATTLTAPPSVPSTAEAAVAALRGAETAAATRRRRQASHGGPELARLLASVAACEAAHAALLEEAT